MNCGGQNWVHNRYLPGTGKRSMRLKPKVYIKPLYFPGLLAVERIKSKQILACRAPAKKHVDVTK